MATSPTAEAASILDRLSNRAMTALNSSSVSHDTVYRELLAEADRLSAQRLCSLEVARRWATSAEMFALVGVRCGMSIEQITEAVSQFCPSGSAEVALERLREMPELSKHFESNRAIRSYHKLIRRHPSPHASAIAAPLLRTNSQPSLQPLHPGSAPTSPGSASPPDSPVLRKSPLLSPHCDSKQIVLLRLSDITTPQWLVGREVHFVRTSYKVGSAAEFEAYELLTDKRSAFIVEQASAACLQPAKPKYAAGTVEAVQTCRSVENNLYGFPTGTEIHVLRVRFRKVPSPVIGNRRSQISTSKPLQIPPIPAPLPEISLSAPTMCALQITTQGGGIVPVVPASWCQDESVAALPMQLHLETQGAVTGSLQMGSPMQVGQKQGWNLQGKSLFPF